MDYFTFKVGDRVYKPSGYSFEGVVVAAFETTAGKERYVVECQVPGAEGMLHIYNAGQLQKTIVKGTAHFFGGPNHQKFRYDTPLNEEIMVDTERGMCTYQRVGWDGDWAIYLCGDKEFLNDGT